MFAIYFVSPRQRIHGCLRHGSVATETLIYKRHIITAHVTMLEGFCNSWNIYLSFLCVNVCDVYNEY